MKELVDICEILDSFKGYNITVGNQQRRRARFAGRGIGNNEILDEGDWLFVAVTTPRNWWHNRRPEIRRGYENTVWQQGTVEEQTTTPPGLQEVILNEMLDHPSPPILAYKIKEGASLRAIFDAWPRFWFGLRNIGLHQAAEAVMLPGETTVYRYTEPTDPIAVFSRPSTRIDNPSLKWSKFKDVGPKKSAFLFTVNEIPHQWKFDSHMIEGRFWKSLSLWDPDSEEYILASEYLDEIDAGESKLTDIFYLKNIASTHYDAVQLKALGYPGNAHFLRTIDENFGFWFPFGVTFEVFPYRASRPFRFPNYTSLKFTGIQARERVLPEADNNNVFDMTTEPTATGKLQPHFITFGEDLGVIFRQPARLAGRGRGEELGVGTPPLFTYNILNTTDTAYDWRIIQGDTTT